MAIDTTELAAATNFVHRKLVEAAAAQRTGKGADAVEHIREAVAVACRTMQNLVTPHSGEVSREISRHRRPTHLRDLFQNKDAIREFLNAEEKLLQDVGLEPAVVESVMDRCIDYLERGPEELTEDHMRQAFAEAEYRVCGDAPERLAKASETQDRYEWRIPGRIALRTMVGVTIIGANYTVFGPAEAFGQISTAYGVSWLPIWPQNARG